MEKLSLQKLRYRPQYTTQPYREQWRGFNILDAIRRRADPFSKTTLFLSQLVFPAVMLLSQSSILKSELLGHIQNKTSLISIIIAV